MVIRINKMKLQTNKYQHGVVLIVSLVFLIALTAVAAALMQNTTSDMKMSGASEEKVVATQEAISSVDESIYEQVKGGGNNAFASALVLFPLSVTLPKTSDDAVSNIDIPNNQYTLEADCPHSRSASSVQVFACNVLRVQVIKKYGRANTNEIEVNSGIAQQLLR